MRPSSRVKSCTGASVSFSLGPAVANVLPVDKLFSFCPSRADRKDVRAATVAEHLAALSVDAFRAFLFLLVVAVFATWAAEGLFPDFGAGCICS